MPLSCSNRRHARPGALAIVLLAACGLSTSSLGARAAAGLTTTLRWYAPFLSGGGYSSEALSYVLALALDPGMDSKLWIEQHGDAPNHEVIQGFAPEVRELLWKLMNPPSRKFPKDSIVICHSEPGAWSVPKSLFSTTPCPPGGHKGYTIGRTMFETDRLSAEHVKRCNKMDEVWVPTQFNFETFASSGVERNRLKVVPQGVDADFFDPAQHEPMRLPVGKLVFGNERSAKHEGSKKPFIFLSVFKWEERKAWDILLKAFLTEFTAEDPVELLLLTKPYHSSSDFKGKMQAWARKENLTDTKASSSFAPVYVESSHIPQQEFPGLYLGADAFVLPSRGEGWGRPHMEAMAMGLPVLATNWSGPTAFLSDDTGYPLPIDGLTEIKDGPFKGHMWASPSVTALSLVMRRVVENQEEAREKGRRARDHVLKNFSPAVVAKAVKGHLMRIEQAGKPQQEDPYQLQKKGASAPSPGHEEL